MRKLLNNKLLMMPLIIVLTIAATMVVFAPSGIKAAPNKHLEFKAVKFCTPAILQKAIQKIIKEALALAVSWIPGGYKAVKRIPDKAIPVPCGCQAKGNLYDSSLIPMNVKRNPFDWFEDVEVKIGKYNLTQSTQKKLLDVLEELAKPKKPKNPEDALWTEVQKQQAAMIKKGSPAGPDVFMNTYRALRRSLSQANALSLAEKFEDEFKKRFPNMSENVESMTDAEKRMAENWRQIMDAWMKALNMAGLNFDNEQKIRNQLTYVILTAYDDSVYKLGQTHMIQYLGAVLAQGNAVVDRTGTELRGIMEMCGA